MPESAAAGLTLDPEIFIQDFRAGFLEEMKAVLQAAGITDPIYTGWQPDAPGTCLTLYEYAGRPADTQTGTETPGLQVRIRQAVSAQDYQAGRNQAQAVFMALHDKKNFKSGRTTYIHITAQQSPFFLSRDANNRPEFIINFLVKKISI